MSASERFKVLPKNYRGRGFELCGECGKLRPVEDYPTPLVDVCEDCYQPSVVQLQPQGVGNLSGPERNSLYSIVKGIQFLSLCSEINSERQTRMLLEILSGAEMNAGNLRQLGRLLQQDGIREMMFYLVKVKAATYLTISRDLRQPESTTWRNLNMLTDLTLIRPALPIRPDLRKAGRRVIVFQTPDAAPENIREAIELHRRLKSPVFASAYKVTQLLMDDYAVRGRENSINYRELVEVVKASEFPEPLNIAGLVARQLAESGWRVWR